MGNATHYSKTYVTNTPSAKPKDTLEKISATHVTRGPGPQHKKNHQEESNHRPNRTKGNTYEHTVQEEMKMKTEHVRNGPDRQAWEEGCPRGDVGSGHRDSRRVPPSTDESGSLRPGCTRDMVHAKYLLSSQSGIPVHVRVRERLPT